MIEQPKNLLLEGGILRALFSLAVPLVLANILQAGYQMTDAFWVGRLGSTAVAAVAVSFPITFLVIALGSGLAMAGSTLSAQYMGAGRRDMVNHVAAQTIIMVTLTSIVLGICGYCISPLLLTLMGVAPGVYHAALGFMHVSFLGLIFVFFFYMFQALMRGIGQTRIPLLIVLTTVVLNFAFDPLFIFGKGFIPSMGVMGAAVATLFTQFIAALIGFIVLVRGKHGIQLSLHDLQLDPVYIKRAFSLGIPSSIELSSTALGLVIMSFLVSTFGTVTIAAYGVGSNVLQLVMIPAMGIAMAVATLVGQNIGAGNPNRAERITHLGILYGLGILTTVGVLAYIFAPAIIGFFIPADPAVIAEGTHFIRTSSWAWGGLSIQFCVAAAFRASGNMLNAMVIAIVSQFLLQFPMAYILSQHTALGAQGLWWSFPIRTLITAIVAMIWFSNGKWKLTRLTQEAQDISHTIQEVIIEEGRH